MTRGITEPPLLSVDSSTPAFLEMGEWWKWMHLRRDGDRRTSSTFRLNG